MALSIYDIKRIIRPKEIYAPSDDFRVLDSWTEVDDSKDCPARERTLKYLCYRIAVMDPDTGEERTLYKALKFARVIRLPKSAKQSTSLADMHSQILAAVYESHINLVTVIANIIEPALGLLYLYGVQGTGYTIDDAKRAAKNSYVGFTHAMQGTYRVLEMRTINAQEAEWLREKMYNMEYMTAIRGIPKYRDAAADMGVKSVTGKPADPDAQGTLEEIITGMADYEYVLQILSTPVGRNALTAWQTQTQKDMTNWYGQLQGTKSLSANLSIPMMYMANTGISQGWNKGYTDADSVSYNRGSSFNAGFGQSVGEGLSQSFSESFGRTQGVSVTDSVSQSHSISLGQTQGLTTGITHGQGTNSGFNIGQSQNVGLSNNAGINQGQNVSHSQGTGVSNGMSVGTSENYGQSASESISQTHSQSTSQGISWNSGITQGQTLGSSINHGVTHSFGTSQNIGGSVGTSNGWSSSTTENSGRSENHSLGTSNGQGSSTTTTDGVSGGLGVSVFGINGSVNGSHSDSNSLSINVSANNSDSSGFNTSTGFSKGTSGSTSQSQNWGFGASESVGETESIGQTASNSFSQSFSQGGNFGIGESFGTSHGQTLGESWGISKNVSNSLNISQNASDSFGQSIGLSQSVGQNRGWGASQGASIGQNESVSQSASASQSQSFSESLGLTRGHSEGQSFGNSYTQGVSNGKTENWSQSQNVSRGESTGEGTSQSHSTNTGSSGGITTGTSSSMGLGPSIGYSKSYQWKDKEVEDLLEILQYQNERLKKALRGQGAFYTYVYLAVPNMDALEAAKTVAKSTWQNDYALSQPLQIMDLTELEQKHLLYHFSAFSTDVTREIIGGAEEYKYATVLLPTEYVAYTHLPRISEGGIFSEVNDIPNFAVPSMMRGEIYMGTVISAERYTINNGYNTPFEYRLPEKGLMHGFFTGASRSGKTVAAMRFVAELAHVRRSATGKRLRIICMDPKHDWRTIARFVEPERFNFYSLGDKNFHPLHFNPCKIPHGVDAQRWIDGMIDIYCRAYGLLERGKQILGETLYALYDEAGVFKAMNSPDWMETVPELSKKVTFTAAYKKMERIKEGHEDPSNVKGKIGNDTRDAYARLLDRLQAFSRPYSVEHMLFGREDGVSIDEIIGNDDVTVFESEGLESSFANFIFGVLTSGIYKYGKSHEGGFLSEDQYETVLVIEEANKVFTGSDVAGTGSGKSFGMTGQSEFEEILDQSAGYGLFIFCITQRLSQMPSAVIANSGIAFIGKLKEEKDIQVAITSIGRDYRFQDRELVKWFPRSPTGWFVCMSSRCFDIKDAEPVMIKVSPLNMAPPSNAEIEELLTTREMMTKLKNAA